MRPMGLGSMSRVFFLFTASAQAACNGSPPGGGGNPDEAGFAIGQELRAASDSHPSASYLPNEILGSGVALLDMDGDGDLDVYLRERTSAPIEEGGQVHNSLSTSGDRLFRNQWVETGALDFVDITDSAGLRSFGIAAGVAVGDIDNDGDPDLFLTNLGPDVLLENRDGVFVPRPGPWIDGLWSAPASFFDADGDGHLDLFVGRYLAFDPDRHRPCPGADTRPDYCDPMSYSPLTDAIYRNFGGGRFEQIRRPHGIGSVSGNALGVVTDDFDGDGRIDVFVANDGGKNHFWLNRDGFRFEERAGVRGLAVNANGQREAGMGIAAADFDRDGDTDLVITHLTGESHTLYVNRGDGFFDDQTLALGLELPSLSKTGFGVGWLYADSDAWLDLMTVNGRISSISEQRGARVSWPYRETPQLMLSKAGARFRDGSAEAGPFFQQPMVGRSAAFGDLDSDGDLDVVVTDNDGTALVLENHGVSPLDWIGFSPLTGDPARPALGAEVVIVLDDGTTLAARSRTDGSYLAACDPRILFRLPPGAAITSIQITWPSGRTETIASPGMNRYHAIVEDGTNDV